MNNEELLTSLFNSKSRRKSRCVYRKDAGTACNDTLSQEKINLNFSEVFFSSDSIQPQKNEDESKKQKMTKELNQEVGLGTVNKFICQESFYRKEKSASAVKTFASVDEKIVNVDDHDDDPNDVLLCSDRTSKFNNTSCDTAINVDYVDKKFSLNIDGVDTTYSDVMDKRECFPTSKCNTNDSQNKNKESDWDCACNCINHSQPINFMEDNYSIDYSEDDIDIIKYRHDQLIRQDDVNKVQYEGNLFTRNLNKNDGDDDILNISGKFKAMEFSKSSLQDMRVIAQLDLKFILVVHKNTLIALDQHAADERIKVETLMKQVYIEGKEITKKKLDPPIQIKSITLFEIDILNQDECESILKEWNFEFEIEEINVQDSSSRHRVFLRAVPVILGKALGLKHFRQIIHETFEKISLVNCKTFRPQAVQNIINYKACRSAIKFGDYLSIEECKKIFQNLIQCDFPFQCAHGRPSMAPLADYKTYGR